MNTAKTKFRISQRKLSRLTGWTLGITAVCVLAGFVRSESRSKTCRSVDIRIIDGYGFGFVTPADVESMLEGKSKQPVGKKLIDINMAMLEKLISNNSYVAAAEVFSTIDGTLHVEVRQRKPVIRIINNEEEHFYVDESGEFMPVSPQYSADVVIASGFIFNRYIEKSIYREETSEAGTAGTTVEQLYKLAMFISGDSFWNAQIEQVYVNERQQIELVPRVGNHIVLLGSTLNMADKFEKLKLFYREGLDHTGWDLYKKINLLYDKQVVCSKQEGEPAAQTTNNEHEK